MGFPLSFSLIISSFTRIPPHILSTHFRVKPVRGCKEMGIPTFKKGFPSHSSLSISSFIRISLNILLTQLLEKGVRRLRGIGSYLRFYWILQSLPFLSISFLSGFPLIADSSHMFDGHAVRTSSR